MGTYIGLIRRCLDSIIHQILVDQTRSTVTRLPPSESEWRRLDSRLYECIRNGVQYVWTDDEVEVVRLGGPLLLVHQFRQLENQRRYQTDPQQLHVVDICRGHVLSSEPAPHGPPLVFFVTMFVFSSTAISS